MGVVKKENTAAAAFRRYARLGLDCPMQWETKYRRIRGIAASAKDRAQLFAVWEILHLFEAFGEAGTLRAVRALWMEEGQTVSAYSLANGCSERATFRRLAEVRDCFERLSEKWEKETV